ncbi:MAG: 30S ribosomal protein S2 [Candidatus Paceibacterota bacterium]
MVKIEEMFRAGIHFGYSRSSRHPKMKDFLFGLKNNVEIFDLEKTDEMLEKAKEFMVALGKEKKKFVLVGTKTEAKAIVEKFAKEINMPYVIERWLGGTFTNFKGIRDRINHMKDLEQKKMTKELEKYTKKEQLEIEREIIRLRNYLGGLVDMENLPSAILVIDSKKEKNAVKEANDTKVPVVAIINTDCDPNVADYPIPANDNSRTSIEFLLNELVGAYKEGVKEFKEKEAEK